jgi:hypothetical protein
VLFCAFLLFSIFINTRSILRLMRNMIYSTARNIFPGSAKVIFAEFLHFFVCSGGDSKADKITYLYKRHIYLRGSTLEKDEMLKETTNIFRFQNKASLKQKYFQEDTFRHPWGYLNLVIKDLIPYQCRLSVFMEGIGKAGRKKIKIDPLPKPSVLVEKNKSFCRKSSHRLQVHPKSWSPLLIVYPIILEI